jgi:hypothetical protein
LVQAEIRGTGVDLTYRHPPAGASG